MPRKHIKHQTWRKRLSSIEDYRQTRFISRSIEYPYIKRREELGFGELYRDRYGDYHIYWTEQDGIHWAVCINADGGDFRAFHVDDNQVLSFGKDWHLDINPLRIKETTHCSDIGRGMNVFLTSEGPCMLGIIGIHNPRHQSLRYFNWKSGFVGTLDDSRYAVWNWDIWASKEDMANSNKSPLLSFDVRAMKAQGVAA